jgi:signal transduction histidine kinase
VLAEETDGILDEKHKRFLGHIRKDSLYLLALINDILDLSKIEAGGWNCIEKTLMSLRCSKRSFFHSSAKEIHRNIHLLHRRPRQLQAGAFLTFSAMP